MQEKKHNEAKKEIRSVLLTYPKGVTLEEFLKTYRGLVGQSLPSRASGFSSDVAFLQSMPDVVNVFTDANGKIKLTGIADEASQHIQKLVSRQRNNKPNNKTAKRQPAHRPSSASTLFNVREQQPFLPGPLKAEILKLMTVYQRGIGFPAFAIAYHKTFNKYLPLAKGFETLEAMIKLIPQLEVKYENGEKRICHRNLQSDRCRETYRSERDTCASQVKNKPVLQDSFNIHKSGISDDILQNFQMVLQKCPEGIQDIHFPPLYENFTGKPFELHELGYNSMSDLVDALPHIFQRVLNPEDNRSWILLPAGASVKRFSKVDDSSVSSHKKQSPPKCGGIPADAASPVLQYIQSSIPEYVDVTEYVPVFLTAIRNPSLFWFRLQTDEAAKSFEMFEKDMISFYDAFSQKYKMNEGDIAIGATCVILCPDDKEWYRAVIKSIPGPDLVNVSYIDYGSRDNIPRDNLFYVRSKYHDYPACAFKAQLAAVKPAHNASVWSIRAQQRFIQLSSCGNLMANLKCVNKGIYSVYLCDTNGETDIHLSDALINEGFAELNYEDNFDLSISSAESDSAEISICNGTKTDTENEFSPRSDQDMLPSDKNDSISESEFLPVNRKLSFSPKEVQCNGIIPSISSVEKGQSSKRYVKLLQLCEDTKMHFINLENMLYMSCADISKLIWSDKDSNFLIERLKFKEVDVPFLQLSKENHDELFKQCIWYKVPEFETLESNNSPLIVCPLEWALKILNIFGHPSVCFRLAILDEIRRFDPFDSVWKEFCEYSYDFCDREKEIEQSISKLCLYDLRARNEAFKIRRLKLLRTENSSEKETNLKILEMHQRVIGGRIKQIEAVCSQYSSVS